MSKQILETIKESIEQKQIDSYERLCNVVGFLMPKSWGWGASMVIFNGHYQGIRLQIFNSKNKEFILPGPNSAFNLPQFEDVDGLFPKTHVNKNGVPIGHENLNYPLTKKDTWPKLDASTLPKLKLRGYWNGFEINPVHVIGKSESGKDIIEQCEPEEAQAWSVYIHLVDGGSECISDHATQQDAETFVTFLKVLIENYTQPEE